MDSDKIVKLLGFARRAGKVAIGRSAVEKAFKKRNLALVILATDATPKAERVVAHLHGVPSIRFGTKAELGALSGRTETGMIGLLDRGFAVSIRAAAGISFAPKSIEHGKADGPVKNPPE